MLASKVAEAERAEGGDGIEGEALLQWYLEQKEDELQGEEDYNRELVLAKKVLRKMVRVCIPCRPLSLRNKMLTSSRTMCSWRFAARV
jgi:hypothetical protein